MFVQRDGRSVPDGGARAVGDHLRLDYLGGFVDKLTRLHHRDEADVGVTVPVGK